MVSQYWIRRLNREVKTKTKDLFELKEKYKDLLDDLPALICEVLPDGTLTYANKSFCEFFKIPLSYTNRPVYMDVLPKEEFDQLKAHYKALTAQKPYVRYEYQVTLDQVSTWHEWRIRAIYDEVQTLINYYIIGIDITERKASEEKLIYLSYHDHLTGLYNRRFYEEELRRLDTKRNYPLTIVIADVNGLKMINDSFGHATGDELLVKTAQILRHNYREDDIISRIGGDEFAIILPKTPKEEVDRVIKRIKDEIATDDNDKYVLSVSFGHGTKNSEDVPMTDVFIEAENYMYSAKMYESSSMRSKTIEVIMNSLYEKSERELAHSKRVGDLCAMIATEMGYDDQRIQVMRLSGLVHDIGKIGVEEKILNKPEKLTEEEWQEMKHHPEAGWRILSSVREFSEISDFVLAHHEKWSGEGYPNQLAGEAIPIEARILAVADAFDAMTSKRSYRSPMRFSEAKDELERFAGTQFDPDIVHVFLERVLPELSESQS